MSKQGPTDKKESTRTYRQRELPRSNTQRELPRSNTQRELPRSNKQKEPTSSNRQRGVNKFQQTKKATRTSVCLIGNFFLRKQLPK